MIFILVLFTLFWRSYSRGVFLAGLFNVDELAVKHSCSNMIPVIVGTEYVVSSSTTSSLSDYLGVSGGSSLPTAQSLMSKVEELFPDLIGRIGIIVTPIGVDLPETRAGLSDGDVNYLLMKGFLVTNCNFLMYSVNDSVTASVKLIIYQ